MSEHNYEPYQQPLCPPRSLPPSPPLPSPSPLPPPLIVRGYSSFVLMGVCYLLREIFVHFSERTMIISQPEDNYFLPIFKPRLIGFITTVSLKRYQISESFARLLTQFQISHEDVPPPLALLGRQM